MRVERVGTRDQAADILTKGNHGRVEWNRLVVLAGMVNTTGRAAMCYPHWVYTYGVYAISLTLLFEINHKVKHIFIFIFRYKPLRLNH